MLFSLSLAAYEIDTRKDSTLMPFPFHSSNPSFYFPSCLHNIQKMEKTKASTTIRCWAAKEPYYLSATQPSSDLHYTIKCTPQLTQPCTCTTQAPAGNKTIFLTGSYLQVCSLPYHSQSQSGWSCTACHILCYI